MPTTGTSIRHIGLLAQILCDRRFRQTKDMRLVMFRRLCLCPARTVHRTCLPPCQICGHTEHRSLRAQCHYLEQLPTHPPRTVGSFLDRLALLPVPAVSFDRKPAGTSPGLRYARVPPRTAAEALGGHGPAPAPTVIHVSPAQKDLPDGYLGISAAHTPTLFACHCWLRI